MYNKLFTKILDSSVWMEAAPTRIVWFTLLAAMDWDGFAQFASIANLAHRARVTPKEAQDAVEVLEGPDPFSSDPDHEGSRIERVPGGWYVRNCEKYNKTANRESAQAQTRERSQRYRERSARLRHAPSRSRHAPVTPTDTDTTTTTEALEVHTSAETDFETFHAAYPAGRRVGGKPGRQAFKTAMAGKPQAHHLAVMLQAIQQQKRSEQWQTPKLIPLMTTWLHQERWLQTLPEPGQMAPTNKRIAGLIQGGQRFLDEK